MVSAVGQGIGVLDGVDVIEGEEAVKGVNVEHANVTNGDFDAKLFSAVRGGHAAVPELLWDFSFAIWSCFSVSNAWAAWRRTKEYCESHPVEPAPEDPAEVTNTFSCLSVQDGPNTAQFQYTQPLKQESLANAKVNARQHCVSLSCLCRPNSLTQIEWVVQLLLPPKHAKSRDIPREFDLTAVQGHPRSSILVSIESPYVTSY